MREYKSLVKCYQRKKSRQYLITLKGDHGFKPDEPVVVLPEDGFSELVALQDTARDHKNELLLKDKEISQVKLDLQSSRDEVETKTRALIEHESRVSVYEDNIKHLKDDLQALKDKNLQLEKDLEASRDEIGEHRLRIRELEKLELEDYQGLYNKLRNKHDHLQERFNKSLEEVNGLQRVVSDLSNRGFVDYLTGRLPESYKKLQAPEVTPETKGEI